MAKPKLNAQNLCNALWETLHKVKDSEIHPSEADAVAAQAREILRTRRTQMQIQKFDQVAASKDLVDCAKS